MPDASRVALAGAGTALFRLVRFWSRRWSLRVAEQLTGEQRRVQDVLVLEAVDTAARFSADVSVADVANHLGIDSSGASRVVANAVERGYLQRAAAASDARRAVLTVTQAGQELITGAHAWQEDVFSRLTAGWEPADAARFAGYLSRLAEELLDPQPAAGTSSRPDTSHPNARTGQD